MSGTTCIMPQWYADIHNQENLDLKIKKWKEESPDNNFFFRPYCLTSDSESYQQPQSLKEEDSTDVIKISIGDPF